MDKNIVDTLIKFGLITNICVNHNDYKDIDDLINKGIITIPGAKERINELLKDIEENTDIVEQDVKTIVETIEPTEVKPIEVKPDIIEPIVITPTKEEEIVVEDKKIIEEQKEQITVDDTNKEKLKTNKSKKQTNKIE